ncbi:hypothetical protein JTE90_025421 [Oedothorax gibbosus]|uniref:Uncharacterized protein n=1 Tax=Oedothorax gibbosus TaxID=931172 RepID=A0AAV6U9T6_9ARAC|nr:hypothetical protein JTE90_025421 [Oedothorax gibbosus]
MAAVGKSFARNKISKLDVRAKNLEWRKREGEEAWVLPSPFPKQQLTKPVEITRMLSTAFRGQQLSIPEADGSS